MQRSIEKILTTHTGSLPRPSALIFTAKPIQRAWRDIHAGALHVSLTWDAVSTMYGQYALGLDPKGQF